MSSSVASTRLRTMLAIRGISQGRVCLTAHEPSSTLPFRKLLHDNNNRLGRHEEHLHHIADSVALAILIGVMVLNLWRCFELGAL